VIPRAITLAATLALLLLLAYLAFPVAPLERWEDGSGVYHARAGDVGFCTPGELCAEDR
jgi:hypothetical protein